LAIFDHFSNHQLRITVYQSLITICEWLRISFNSLYRRRIERETPQIATTTNEQNLSGHRLLRLIGSEVTNSFMTTLRRSRRETISETFSARKATLVEQQRLIRDLLLQHHELDIRDRAGVLRLVQI